MKKTAFIYFLIMTLFFVFLPKETLAKEKIYNSKYNYSYELYNPWVKMDKEIFERKTLEEKLKTIEAYYVPKSSIKDKKKESELLIQFYDVGSFKYNQIMQILNYEDNFETLEPIKEAIYKEISKQLDFKEGRINELTVDKEAMVVYIEFYQKIKIERKNIVWAYKFGNSGMIGFHAEMDIKKYPSVISTVKGTINSFEFEEGYRFGEEKPTEKIIENPQKTQKVETKKAIEFQEVEEKNNIFGLLFIVLFFIGIGIIGYIAYNKIERN